MFQSIKPNVQIASGCCNVEYSNEVEYHFSLGQPNLKGVAIVIDNEYECKYACERIQEYCSQCKVVGLDAEWLPSYIKGTKNRVALLQIATPQKGDVFLYRLNILRCVPDCLKSFLQDESIAKVGVSPKTDSDNLEVDYNVSIRGLLDLRLLYNTMNGLATLANQVLKTELSKGFVTVSNWEQAQLSLQQIQYAAADAYASVELFKRWAGIAFDSYGHPSKPWSEVKIRAAKYLDKPFRKVGQVVSLVGNELRQTYVSSLAVANERASVSEASTCISSVNSPGNSFLWNVSKSDAEALVREGKGEIIAYTVRLYHDKQQPQVNVHFPEPPAPLIKKVTKTTLKSRPAVRIPPVYDENSNSGTPKDSGSAKPFEVPSDFWPANACGPVVETPSAWVDRIVPATAAMSLEPKQCAVCGSSEIYCRKNIVPKSYLKYFPKILAGISSSRDVVPFCITCEKKSATYSQVLTDHLKYVAGNEAPTNSVALNIEEMNAQMYIRPRGPRPITVTANFLRESRNWKKDDEHYLRAPLAEAVVKLYQINNIPLTKLQKLWREMFMEAMEPQFLPANWSVDLF